MYSVFLITMATVRGPTPPGTGVMTEAFCATASKSTSPTILNLPLAVLILLIPTDHQYTLMMFSPGLFEGIVEGVAEVGQRAEWKESWVIWILVSLLLGSVVARSLAHCSAPFFFFLEWEQEHQCEVGGWVGLLRSVHCT